MLSVSRSQSVLSVIVFLQLSHVMMMSINSSLSHEGYGGWGSAFEGVPADMLRQVLTPCDLKTWVRCSDSPAT